MTGQEVYRAEDFTEGGKCHGLSCAACGTVFVEGQPIAELLDGVDEFASEPMFCVTLVCVPCSLARSSTRVTTA
jgi:hypothetical protein